MKEIAALVLITLSIVVVSVTKTATHQESSPIIIGGVTLASNPAMMNYQAPQKHIVEIKGFKFDVAELSVQVGDTIVWVNKDIVPHTATANDKSWDSDLLNEKEMWQYIPEENGEDEYFCKYHPTMKGKISVN